MTVDTNKYRPGCLSKEWVANPHENDDPWVLETTEPFDEGHRSAFLGNGEFGQRIGIDGDAAVPMPEQFDHLSESCCLKHGFWGEKGLMDIPKWAVLKYHDGKMPFAPDQGCWKNYRQSLDMKTATLTTEIDWESKGQVTHIEKTCLLSRSRVNVAVMSLSITPDFDGTVTITDELDGRFIEDARAWRSYLNSYDSSNMALEARMGPNEQRIVVVSKLILDHSESVNIDRFEKYLKRDLTVKLSKGQTFSVHKIVTIITGSESANPLNAACTLAEGTAGNLTKMKAEHCDAWEKLWLHALEVPSLPVQKIINASLYQLYSNTRIGSKWSPGPTGLAAKAWKGNVFWDSDLWMFPVLGLLNPELSKPFVEYRFQTLPGARRNAYAEGYDGAMFPWQSSETGDEIIPELVFHHQHHVNSDIAIAQWWYFLLSGDQDYLKNKAAEVIIESARFWASFAEYNEEMDRYEIRRVCCAGEWAEIQNNNAYTSYSAAFTIRLAKKVAEMTGRKIPENWLKIAENIWLPFDEENQRYLEHEKYTGKPIKQADATLLIYPYEMPMSEQIKANNVDYYRGKFEGNIMMGNAFDGIVDCELGRRDRCWESFLELLPYFRRPFLLASESPQNENISFATGLGGLMQLWMMGFAGIRIHDDGLMIQPCLPHEIPYIKIRGIHYQGVSFDLYIKNDYVEVTNASAEIDFKIYNRSGKLWSNS